MKSKKFFLGKISILLFFSIAFLNSVSAKDIFVNGTYNAANDVYTKAIGNTANSGLTALLPKKTLSEAINIAVAGDVIYVDADTYIEGNFTISKAITIIGAGSGKTIFNGNNKSVYFANIKSSNVSIRNLSATKYFYDNSSFGQVININGAFTGIKIENVVITDCLGGTSTLPNLYISTGASVTVRNCFFKCSGYNGARGGGILVKGATLVLENTVFKQSQNTLDYGGGLKIDGTSIVTVKNCSFFDCIGQIGGGAIGMSAGKLDVSGSCFTGNFSRTDDNNSGGGAVFIKGGSGSFTNCSFSNNKTTAGGNVAASTSADGGAIRFANSIFTMNTCSFQTNQAGVGSGSLGEDIALISGTLNLSQIRFESLYTSLASDVNIYRLAGTVSFANSGQPVTTVGVAITKPEMNGTFTSTNVLSPTLSPVTACANSNIINCGFESPTYCQTEKNPPIIFHCVDDKTLTNCSGNIPDFTKSPELTFYEYCGYTVTQSIPTTTLISSIGNKTVPVTITITDNTGNISSCTFNLTISGCGCTPTTAPILNTQNITVQLDATGNSIITASQINNGSVDACGLTTLTYSLSKTTFNCSNIGLNTITFTATDSKGNTASKSVTVTVQDKIAPTIITQNFTAQLDATGNATITTANINNGSSDNCSIKTIALDKTTFNCSNIGVNTVTLTVEDVNGNIASKTATVTVLKGVQTNTIVLSSSNPVVNNNYNVIYLGYMAQSIDLTSFSTGGTSFTYEWTGNYLTNNTSNTATFTPTQAGTYTITNKSTNQGGCSVSASVNICVIDVRSEITDKVLICQKGPDGLTRTLSVTSSDASLILAQDKTASIGRCNTDCSTTPVVHKVVNISDSKSLYSVPGYVIAQNYTSNGTGWSAGLYTPYEMTNKNHINEVNVLSSLRWRIDRDMNYGSQHRIYKDVNIYMYHYGTNNTFPNTNKPTLPSNAVKVFSGDLDFQLPDNAYCFMDVPFNMNDFVYDGISSVVVYIEKKTPSASPSVTDPWASYNEDANKNNIRFVGNWGGYTNTTSNYYSTMKQNRYPQVIFNETNTVDLCNTSIMAATVVKSMINTNNQVQVNSLTGSIYNAEVLVYPNPAVESFNFKINSGSTELVSIIVYNLTGNIIYEGKDLLPNQIYTIGSEFYPGIYMAEVQQGAYKKVIKISKN